jgi:hypothetical protein
MNDKLIKYFTIFEIHRAIKGMEDVKALHNNGIPIEFLKECWHIVKG